MNTCKICRHPEVEIINARIVRQTSLRDISLQFGEQFSHQSVVRHIENCLKLSLQIVREKNLIKQGVSFEEELERLFVRLNKLIDANEAWLTDPDNPDKYTLDPRADEINVVYLDYEDLNQKTCSPKKKRENLHRLLHQVQFVEFNKLLQTLEMIKDDFDAELVESLAGRIKEMRDIQVKDVLTINIKGVDKRSLLVETTIAINKQIETLGKANGKFQKPRENEMVMRNICETIKEHASKGVPVGVLISEAARKMGVNPDSIKLFYSLNYDTVSEAEN